MKEYIAYRAYTYRDSKSKSPQRDTFSKSPKRVVSKSGYISHRSPMRASTKKFPTINDADSSPLNVVSNRPELQLLIDSSQGGKENQSRRSLNLGKSQAPKQLQQLSSKKKRRSFQGVQCPRALPPSLQLQLDQQSESNNFCIKSQRNSKSMDEVVTFTFCPSNSNRSRRDTEIEDYSILNSQSDVTEKEDAHKQQQTTPMGDQPVIGVPVENPFLNRESNCTTGDQAMMITGNFDAFEIEGNNRSLKVSVMGAQIHGTIQLGSKFFGGARYFKIKSALQRKGSFYSSFGNCPIVQETKEVFRRYSDFEIFQIELVDQNLHRFVPGIPPKSFKNLYSNDSSDFVAERLEQLQKFLNQVLEDSELSRSAIVTQFLTCTEREFQLVHSKMITAQQQRASTCTPSHYRHAAWANSVGVTQRLPVQSTSDCPISGLSEHLYQAEVVSRVSQFSDVVQSVSSSLKPQNELQKRNIELSRNARSLLQSVSQLAAAPFQSSSLTAASTIQTSGQEKTAQDAATKDAQDCPIATTIDAKYQELSQIAEQILRQLESAKNSIVRRQILVARYQHLLHTYENCDQAQCKDGLIQQMAALRAEVNRATEGQRIYMKREIETTVNRLLQMVATNVATCEAQRLADCSKLIIPELQHSPLY